MASGSSRAAFHPAFEAGLGRNDASLAAERKGAGVRKFGAAERHGHPGLPRRERGPGVSRDDTKLIHGASVPVYGEA
jgi:hypothetical protein